tara:strand:+ start:81 stop:449 length:369 start_codon:yes stop_codon:yes gene_type:complete
MKETTNYIALCLGLVELLKKKKLHEIGIVQFIKDASKILKKDTSSEESKISALVSALKEIGKGSDGVFGTEDDLISESTMDEITTLSKTSLLTDMVTIFIKRKNKSFAGRLTVLFKCYRIFT